MQSFMPVVDLGKIYLRNVCLEDYLDLYDISRRESVTKYLTYDAFKHPSEAVYMLKEYNLKRPQKGLPVGYAIILKKTQQMIGMIEFHTYISNINACEIGFILHPDFQKKGYMHNCLKKMIQLGFDHLNLNKIIAAHVDLNEASKKVLLDCGFKYEYEEYGKFKKRNQEPRTIIYYSIYRYEYERMI